MTFNTTYTNREVTDIANYLLGKSFIFFQSLRMNGIGSKRAFSLKTGHE
ncbi:MAG: hypothetical protein JXQ93_14045 [Flavobacteriaceae bacterium]